MRVNQLIAIKSEVALASGQCRGLRWSPRERASRAGNTRRGPRRVAGLARHHRRDADATNAQSRNPKPCPFQMKCNRMLIFSSASG